jgi:hypothetical protein
LQVIYSLARTFRETVITRKDPEMIELYGKNFWKVRSVVSVHSQNILGR